MTVVIFCLIVNIIEENISNSVMRCHVTCHVTCSSSDDWFNLPYIMPTSFYDYPLNFYHICSTNNNRYYPMYRFTWFNTHLVLPIKSYPNIASWWIYNTDGNSYEKRATKGILSIKNDGLILNSWSVPKKNSTGIIWYVSFP